MRFSSAYALAASLSTAAAVSQGFNYGATKSDGTFNLESDFESLFTSAKGLAGTDGGFTSARLYTMIQGGSSTNEPTQAIEAAISTGTTLLLGLWASGGQGPFSAEITALKSALAASNAADFAKLVVGISVGSEDLYRNSATGKAADAGVGVDAATVSSYIVQLKEAIAGTALADVPVGHVDTWTGWAQSDDSNIGLVIGNCSFIGVDAYPYFQNTDSNDISSGKSLFSAALAATRSVVGDTEIWITETGWPVSGKTENLAVPSLANAKTYWDEVGCPNFGVTNTWWYTLQDSNGATPNPSFGVIGSSYSTTPLYDLSCKDVSSSSSTSSSSSESSTSTKASSSGSTTVVGSSGGSASSASASASASASTSLAAVSSGSGLSPSEGAGNGVGSSATATASGSASTATASSGNGSLPVGTGSSAGLSTATKSSSSAGSSSTSPVVSANDGSALSGSFIGALGAFLVAIAAL
ncbi:putative glucan endo-1 [Hyphodiscus hymeniophilus]|uniref:Probable glucan endo-1,3-beta-glucosidase eglC n=1 Tax=Hyphodiscus hymeniophilus TaxID=353542 RepID=A0A9P6VP09_9HELO|nr:putative glucan endo-1 [Hyphodiscus hymeniophilus]